jgi:hypothetical protein
MKEYILYYMTEIGIVKKTAKRFSSDLQEAEKQATKYFNDLGLCFLELRVNTHTINKAA